MSTLPLFTGLFAGVFEIILPIGLAIWLTRKFQVRWKVVWVGALAFVLAQAVHIPLLSVLTNAFKSGALPTPPASWAGVFNAILLGLLAGLFEETARVLAYRYLGKEARSWRAGVVLGVGHGGIESLALVGITVLVSYAALLVAQYAPGVIPSTQMQIELKAALGQPWHLPLAGAVERVSAMMIQISLSVVVLQAFLRRNAWWYGLAVLLHTLWDASVVLLTQAKLEVWAIEGIVLVMALISLGILVALKPRQAEDMEVETGEAVSTHDQGREA